MKHLTTFILIVLSNAAFAVVDNDKNDRIVMRQNSNLSVSTDQTEGTRDIANQTDGTTPNSTRIHRTGSKAGL